MNSVLLVMLYDVINDFSEKLAGQLWRVLFVQIYPNICCTCSLFFPILLQNMVAFRMFDTVMSGYCPAFFHVQFATVLFAHLTHTHTPLQAPSRSLIALKRQSPMLTRVHARPRRPIAASDPLSCSYLTAAVFECSGRLGNGCGPVGACVARRVIL